MKITLKEVVDINKRLGGSLISDSSLSFAESVCRNSRSTYRCATAWIRAILIDHPFSDANKRTTVYVIAKLVGIKNKKKINNFIIKVIVRNITSLKKIEEMLKNANR